MSSTNKDVVKEYYRAALAGEIDTVRTLMHVELRVVEAASLPYGGVKTGPDGLVELLHEFYATWDNCQVWVKDLIAENDWVVALTEMSGTAKKSGISFTVPLSEVYRLKDNKIIEITPFYFDTKLLHDAYAGHRQSS